MAKYSYALGLSNPPTNVEELATPLNPPRGRFYEFSAIVDKADAQQAGHGFPYAVWVFDILTVAMVAQLRTFCSGQSNTIYLTTRINDDTFATYQGVMLWPTPDQMDRRQIGGKYMGLEFVFRRLETP